jgi:hypothetical protein
MRLASMAATGERGEPSGRHFRAGGEKARAKSVENDGNRARHPDAESGSRKANRALQGAVSRAEARPILSSSFREGRQCGYRMQASV